MTDPRPPSQPSFEERLERQGERLHVSIGAVCNNHCLFCMEEDREARRAANGAMTPERVRRVLEANRGAEEVCFTSGEPTTRPELPTFAAWARELGYPRVSLMTNGRRLSYRPYAAGLARAGVNRFYLSIHGHTARLHDGLTRTPGSFAQSLAGLDAVAALRPGVEVHTSTVVTTRNLPHLLEVYRLLRARGADQVVFNVMQASGGAHTHFEALFPRYTRIAAAFARLCADAGEARPATFLVDLPPCTTTALPDFNRGFVERYRHYEPPADPSGDGRESARETVPPGREELVLVRRADTDVRERAKRPACGSCRYDPICAGVWRNYLSRHGWEEFVPVPPAGPTPPGGGA